MDFVYFMELEVIIFEIVYLFIINVWEKNFLLSYIYMKILLNFI